MKKEDMGGKIASNGRWMCELREHGVTPCVS